MRCYFTVSKIGIADILPTPSGISCQVGHANLFSDSIAVPPKSGTKKLQFGSGNAGNFGGFEKMSRQLWLTLKIATSEKCNAAPIIIWKRFGILRHSFKGHRVPLHSFL